MSRLGFLNKQNRQKYLYELIVVDDGSKHPLPKLSNVYKITQTVGVSRSRNIGALASLDDCTHLFFTNDDIVLEPKCLEIFVTHQYGAAPKSLLLAVASQIVDHLRGGNQLIQEMYSLNLAALTGYIVLAASKRKQTSV